MKSSVTNTEIMSQLEETLRMFVKENLERMMKEEMERYYIDEKVILFSRLA